jgi:hypothetical protein
MPKSTNNNEGHPDDDARSFDLGTWRHAQVEDPFEDPRVRQRISELIIRAVVKPPRLGG